MSSSQTPEKATNVAWVLRSIPMVHWWFFKILMIGALLAILIIWGIDGLNINTFLSKDFAMLKLSNSEILSQSHGKDSIFTNLSFSPNSNKPQQIDLNQTHNLPLNLSQDVSGFIPQVPSNSTLLPWISPEFESNYSSNLLAKWLTPGGSPCKDSKTVDIRVPNLDGVNQNIVLSTGDIHEFVFQTLDDLGNPHCLSGDYFEIDLSGDNWKSRPPIKDLSNGTYAFSLQVHPDFPGNYNLTIILLFRNYEGLKFSPTRFAFDKTLRVIPITFQKSASGLPEIAQCERLDYSKDVWSGRWTRHAKNESCPISNDGRYRCQEPNFPCRAPWCRGPLGLIESNGWVYSAHCSFDLFTSEKAWGCLNGRWIFWWGDSNHCDTIRNVLNFVLDVHDVPVVPRYFDRNITNPADPTQTVRFTSVFNGHPNDTGNYQGLNSLINPEYRNLLRGYFSGNVVPDTIIMNSGLHDGVFWPNIRSFVRGADFAAGFWAEVIGGVVKRGLLRPEVIYRTTVATGGYARKLAFNPAKMEAFNGVVLDKLRGHGVLNRVIDDFDMTYPWHYDNRCNDGVHYGRAPLKMKWKDGGIGHQYFVDLMLCHVLMNVLCVR
ncbi:hypothetical protein PHJA_000541000 [Phtheirospermum japonicum]|uniref:Uncharacterized protein n=1 Tax=Phtheirospermum japonicum TaxID=374723 RepID=A0A830BGT4_9LAMI|nr:hypothetical protein PHJA_000541000 [Phtheirospermum japonicum]